MIRCQGADKSDMPSLLLILPIKGLSYLAFSQVAEGIAISGEQPVIYTTSHETKKHLVICCTPVIH